MNDNEKKVLVQGGTSLSSMLLVLFIALKLLKVIDWEWYWILSPIWIPIGLWILIIGLCLLIPIAIIVIDAIWTSIESWIHTRKNKKKVKK